MSQIEQGHGALAELPSSPTTRYRSLGDFSGDEKYKQRARRYDSVVSRRPSYKESQEVDQERTQRIKRMVQRLVSEYLAKVFVELCALQATLVIYVGSIEYALGKLFAANTLRMDANEYFLQNLL